jgi:ABC-type uncharacterized transport system auxiliary subunit
MRITTSRRFARPTMLLTGVLASVLTLAGCGLAPATAYIPAVAPGTITTVPGAEGVQLTVTGRNNTEGLILGKMAVLAADAAGFEVEDLNPPGR